MRNVYTSLDIGTDSIKIVVCQLYNNKLNLLAASSVKSEGIKKGMIVNQETASNSIKKAINEVEEMLGIEIKKVIASIPNDKSEFFMVSGKTSVSSESEITGKEVAKVLESSLKNLDIGDNEIVNIVPIDFTLDNQVGLQDPRGKIGHMLSSRAVVSTVPKKNMYNIVSILENIGLEVVDISLNSIGDINTFRNRTTANQMGAIINIGYDSSSITIYNKDIAIKSSVIDLGSKNIDSDIAYIYKISLADSIKLKEKFALSHKRYAGKNEFYEISNKFGEKLKVNQFEISEIVMSRIEEILTLARKEINLLTNRDVDYIIITGGTSSMDSFNVITEEILGNNAKVGSIKVLGVRNNKYSSAVGNIIYFINKLKLRNMEYTMVDDYEYEEENKIMNVINDSMLGKVFGYFFKED